MRFISSLTLLSLAGLGLASPIGSPDEVTDAASGPLGGLTGILGMRNAHKDRRQTGSVGASGNTASVDGEASKSPFDVVPGLHPRGEGEANGDGKGKGKGKCNDTRHTTCLRPDDVNTLVDAYTRMLSKWNDADAKYLADSFVDRSDSINILAGIPLGSPTFPTKQAFIDHEHTQVGGPPRLNPIPLPFSIPFSLPIPLPFSHFLSSDPLHPSSHPINDTPR